MVELDRKLPAILTGTPSRADAAESLGFAQLCYVKKLHGASARFWSEAFQARPNLADDMKVQNRYNAACAAALAGSGQGKDDPPLDDVTKARWRKQALDWLKADLGAWSKILDTGRQILATRRSPRRFSTGRATPIWRGFGTLRHWPNSPCGRQAACRALWVEVDATAGEVSGNQARARRCGESVGRGSSRGAPPRDASVA